MEWLVARLKERSTWLGLTAIVTSFGVVLNPELVESITILGVAIGGLIAAFTKDKTPPAV